MIRLALLLAALSTLAGAVLLRIHRDALAWAEWDTDLEPAESLFTPMAAWPYRGEVS